MQKIFFTFLLIIFINNSWAQSDNCSGAVSLTNGACITGSSAGFTQNIVGCTGNADDDAWYKFVATATSQSLTVTGSAGYDAVLQLFSGPCAALISSGCVDNTVIGQSESIVASGLSIGSTYYVRVYHYGIGSGSSTFTICLTNPPPVPANNDCSGAINLAVNASCVNTLGTTYGATTQTIYPSCTGDANEDVWYTFTATNYTQTIQVSGSSLMDPVVELYNGTSCGALTSFSCTDNTATGGVETVAASGLTPGATYYFRVYDYYSTAGNTFSICVSGTSIIPGSQPNDEPCNAIQIPAVTADCNNYVFSNIGATSSVLPGNPGAVCENYDNASNTYSPSTNGGYGATTKDVWFSITVPASGNIYITPQPNMGAGWIQDGVMALYRGTCGSLTTYTCSDDYDFIGGYNDMQPFIRATGLTPGETVFLRYWGYGSKQGNFGFCVQSPTNDVCANALYICDINGYSATTSPAYKPDWPCNMKGDAETTWNAVTQKYNFAPGSSPSGGIFGLSGTWGVGQPYPVPPNTYAYDVQIDNNSWVRFTAASPTVALRVTVSDCWGTAANSATATVGTPKGVQMQIFSTSSACCGFTPVSDFRQNAATSFTGGVSTYTVNANSLTTGNDYYVMVDGWGGDICKYNIQAISGVALPAITAVPGTICAGQTTTLTAPAGATGYTWEPTGENTRTITVSPGTQMTYTCFVGGVCGYKQTLTKTVYLYTTPTITFSTTNPTICVGNTVSLTAGGANTYTWSGGITNGGAFSPTISNTYTVNATSSNGCTNTAVNTVSVNALPSVTANATSSTVCKGSSVTLTGSGTASSYTWTGGISNGTTFTPSVTTTYTVTGIDGNGCKNTAVKTVTVNSIPSVTATTNGTITCSTPTVNLNSTAVSGATYTWTAPSNSSVTAATSNSINAIGQGAGTYTLNVSSSAGCSFSTTIAAIINTTTPIASATNGTLTCSKTSTVLSGTPSSGVTYNWSGPGILGSTTVANITATVVGTYSLITTNTLTGCSNSVAAIATVTNNLTTPTVSAGANQTITCIAPTVTLTGNASSGSLLSWLNNGVTTNTTTASGASIYTLSATDPNTGCSSTSSVQIFPSNGTPDGTVSVGSNSITCTNTNVAVSISSTCTPISILWTGSSISGSTTSSLTSVSQGGVYNVTIKYTTTGCQSSFPVFVPTNTTAVVASASLTPLSASITCETKSVTLSCLPTGTNYAYSWSGPNILSGSTSANPIVGNGGNYTVTITNTINGCSGITGTTNVSVPSNTIIPTLNLSASSLTTTCGIPTRTVLASSSSDPNTTYTWTVPNTGTISNSSTSAPSIGGTGIFTVSVTNTISGCVSSPKTVSVFLDSNAPTYTLSSITSTINCSIPSPSVSLTSTVSGVTYSWSPIPNSGVTSATPTFTSTGTYSCVITNTSNGCSTNIPSVIVGIDTISPTLDLTPTASITCLSNSVIVTSTVNPICSYSWFGTGIIGSSNTSSITANVVGIYTLTVTNPINGCTTSSTSIIGTNTIAPTLTLSASTAIITCSTSSSILTGVSSVTDTPTWITPTSSSIISNSVTATTSGDYTATVVDATNGCKTSKTITIISNIFPPNANAGPIGTMPCNLSSTTLTGTSSSTDAVSYSWDGPSIGSITSGINSATPIVNSVGIYTLTITNLVTGCMNTSTVEILSNTLTANFTADPMTGEAPLTVNFTDASTTAVTWNWNFGNGSTSISQNPSTLYPNSGTYTVTLIANSNSCSDTIKKIIIVEDGFTVEIPNVFTPNGDGANDLFHIKVTGAKSAEGYIYNRWGQLLFSWDALNKSWDGKASNGENCPDATYYYIIKVVDKKDKVHDEPGYVLIIR